MTNLEQLRKDYPELVADHEKLSAEQLIEAWAGDVLDLFAKERRVALFMEECTLSMSKTNYTLDVLKKLIQEKKEFDIQEWCWLTIDDESEMTDYEIASDVRSEAAKYPYQD